jgi:hypothetical protein
MRLVSWSRGWRNGVGATFSTCNPEKNAGEHTADTCTDTQTVGGITTGEAIIGPMKAVGIYDWHGETMPVGMQVVGTRRIGLPQISGR